VVEQQQRQETTSLNVLVLEGGIKGWVAGGEEYTRRMDGYDAAVWNGEK
jgi:arsenical-resistance protein 2